MNVKIDDLFKMYDIEGFYVNMDMYKKCGMVTLRKEIEEEGTQE